MKLEHIVGVIALLFIIQFFYGMAVHPNAEFAGADSQAENVISSINPNYQPWDPGLPTFKPPSGEIESLLFALQAAIGALVIGYFFGYYRGKNKASQ